MDEPGHEDAMVVIAIVVSRVEALVLTSALEACGILREVGADRGRWKRRGGANFRWHGSFTRSRGAPAKSGQPEAGGISFRWWIRQAEPARVEMPAVPLI